MLNQTPESQLINIREYCRLKNLKLLREFVDHGISGSTEKRPALDEMMGSVSKGEIDVVIVAALDRVSRSTKHFLNLFEELRNKNVSLVSLRENLDFTSPTGVMVASVLASVATLERSIISERIKSSLAARKLAAEKTGSGWRCGRKPLPEVIVKQVVQMRADGKSIREIGRELKIGKTSVERIIRNNKDK